MLVVFSDGFDTTKTRPESAAAAARYFGIPVYPVVLGHGRLVERAQRIQQREARDMTVMRGGGRGAGNARMPSTPAPNPNAGARLAQIHAVQVRLRSKKLGELGGRMRIIVR